MTNVPKIKLLTTVAIIATTLLSTSAHAEGVYTYACHRPSEDKLYAAKLDLTKKTITWDGVVYRNVKQVTNSGECAKACFIGTNRNDMATLNTATQGVASLIVAFRGVGRDGIDEAECDLVR